MIACAQFRADLRLLLRNRASATVCLAVFLFAAATSWVTRFSAAGQLTDLRRMLTESGTDPDTGPCALLAPDFKAEACVAILRLHVNDISPDVVVSQYSELEASVSATSVEGALGFASRQSASIVGLIALGLLVAVHVASLWESGAARPAIAALGTTRIVTQKGLTALVAAMLVLLASALGALVSHFIPVSEKLPSIRGDFGRSLIDFGHAYWMLCSLGLLTVAVAILSRQFVITFAVVMGLMAVCFVATLDRDLYRWSPAGWIATVMGFSRRTRHTVIDYFWTAEVGNYDPVLMGLAMTALGVIPLLLAGFLLWRRKPRA